MHTHRYNHRLPALRMRRTDIHPSHPLPVPCFFSVREYEFDRWFPTCAKVIYDGNREQRRAIREKYIATQNFNVLMTTFEFAMRDKSVLRTVPWEYIIIDEAHRLKNPKCKLAMELATYPTRSRRVALTGTPLQNELHELWSLLNFLHPTIFNSCENFEKWSVLALTTMPIISMRSITDMHAARR